MLVIPGTTRRPIHQPTDEDQRALNDTRCSSPSGRPPGFQGIFGQKPHCAGQRHERNHVRQEQPRPGPAPLAVVEGRVVLELVPPDAVVHERGYGRENPRQVVQERDPDPAGHDRVHPEPPAAAEHGA